MKLLVTTQAVDKNDSNLGFFHDWIAEFAKHCEQVTVICLREGEHSLPGNVTVLSLGKEAGTSRLTRLVRFYQYIYRYRNAYDAVFVHMNPEYVLLGAWLWHRWHKKVALWYAHGSVTRRLRRAVSRADIIFSVSEHSFRVPTPKLHAVGHGIDTELFAPAMREPSTATRIITTGRIAPSKHLIEMLGALDALYAEGKNFEFTIVGEPVLQSDKQYDAALEREIEKRPYRDRIRRTGALPHAQLPAVLNAHDIFFNFSTTGNMDKAGLEALAVGIPLLSTNAAFEDTLAPFGLYVPTLEPRDIAHALDIFFSRSDRAAVAAKLRNKIIDEHSLSKLIPTIVRLLL